MSNQAVNCFIYAVYPKKETVAYKKYALALSTPKGRRTFCIECGFVVLPSRLKRRLNLGYTKTPRSLNFDIEVLLLPYL